MSDRVVLCAGAPAQMPLACELPNTNQHHDFPLAPKIKNAPGAGPLAKARSGKKPGLQTTAENVLRAFNTWAFKREQPSDPHLMLQAISTAINLQAPIPFVLYWGKGPRDQSGAPEVHCLEFLAAMMTRIKDVYKHGAAIKLILTDTHAELNGHSADAIRRYFDDVNSLAASHGIETCWLGHLVKAAGNLATAAPLEDVVATETLSQLRASAEKWYHGPGTPEEGAVTYLRMNLIEQRVVERAFPHSIFITFNGSGLRCLFPKHLPIFYMYSLRRGVAVKPWFLPDEPVKSDLGATQAAPSLPCTN